MTVDCRVGKAGDWAGLRARAAGRRAWRPVRAFALICLANICRNHRSDRDIDIADGGVNDRIGVVEMPLSRRRCGQRGRRQRGLVDRLVEARCDDRGWVDERRRVDDRGRADGDTWRRAAVGAARRRLRRLARLLGDGTSGSTCG